MDAIHAEFATARLGAAYDVLAPDGSEIPVLVASSRGNMSHGVPHPGGVSLAIKHRQVDEVWCITSGRGEVWRRLGDHESIVDVEPGSALTIPVGAHFQFRTVGPEPLQFVMCLLPPWRGAHEAVRVPDHWPVVEAE